jgi:hypothetical protein
MVTVKELTGELRYTLTEACGYEDIKWIDEDSLHCKYNDVPIFITVEIDNKYVELMELEKKTYDIRDSLRKLGYVYAATVADQLANDISKMELEL